MNNKGSTYYAATRSWWKAAKRAIGTALSGKTFDWFMNTIQKIPEIARTQILRELEAIFLSEIKENEIAQRFLVDEILNTAEEFFEIVRNARFLVDSEYMSVRAVVEQISKRAPSEKRIAFWETKTRITTFDQFAKADEVKVSLSYLK